VSDEEAKKAANEAGEPVPAGIRAIAPTGTIGIIGETTTGIEPVFCVAYKRRFLGDNQRWKYQYVIDPTVERLSKEGVDPDDIEDTVVLSKDVEKRISMQAFVQDFIDQAISSTINLPEWGEPGNANSKRFGDILFKYLHRLRGITVYPDGSRPGQPITPVKYTTAKGHENVVYEEGDERCSQGVCGI
jgi:ribonucleoside-diphosphate reductase alpha chain